MLHIAVCDDTEEDCKAVRDHMCDYLAKRGMKAIVESYPSAGALLSRETEYDLYLLDVMMPGMSGMEAAAVLGEQVEQPVIVFITSSLESAVDGYSVNAAGFILKPVRPQEFERTMDRVIRQRLSSKEAVIQVVHNRVPISLQLRKVMYFENRLHRVYVFLAGGEVLVLRQKLTDLESDLDPYPQFLRCHQSYIVNLNQVETLEADSFKLHSGAIVPISRSFYKQCKNAYYHHLLK